MLSSQVLGVPGEEKGKRLKVCHIAGWYPSKEDVVANIFVKEHVKSSMVHNDVFVIVAPKNHLKIRTLYQTEYNLEENIPTLRVCFKKSPIPITNFLIYIFCLFQIFRKLLRWGFKPDVIHAHEYFAGVPGVLLGRFYKLPVVVTEHWSAFPRGMVIGLERLKAKFAFEKADIVCPVSQFLRDAIARLGIRANFRIVPNAVDTSTFYPSEKPLTYKDKKKLLTVARLRPIKGIPYLLEALSLLKRQRTDFSLDIVGDGPNRYEYEELTKEFSLNTMVNFHGLKQKKEVAEFMRSADVFILPSLTENLPCVLIEAMAVGLPIVATSVGGVPEIVKEEMGILVPPKEPQKLAEAINYILDHLEKYQREKMVEEARKRFSYEAVGNELDLIYRSALRRKRGKR